MITLTHSVKKWKATVITELAAYWKDALRVLSWSKDVMTAPKEFRLHTLYTVGAIHERDPLFNLC